MRSPNTGGAGGSAARARTQGIFVGHVTPVRLPNHPILGPLVRESVYGAEPPSCQLCGKPIPPRNVNPACCAERARAERVL